MSDFRAETLYFIVVDRFCDGNPGNNIGKGDDYDATRTDWYKWWGGDLHGVLSRLDYLQSLGATAIWLTPLFDQMDGMAEIDGKRISAYHGYWAKDFKRIDEHFVEREEDVRLFTRDDTIFDRLVAEMHRRGMKLVLDVVCNHSSPSQAGGRGELYDDGVLVAHYDDRTAGRWYRRAAEVSDWSDLHQIQTRELAGLADFDEESWEYRRYIKGALRAWIDKGVDAFRVDTVKHMPLWFWQEFTGDMLVHRPELFMFGEWFQAGCWDADSVQFARWSGMSIIDFAWRNAVVNALAHRTERGFVELGAVIDRDDLFRDPSVLVTFVDNHDLPRFLSISNDPERFRQAVLLTMVARGIPCLYYGGEQLLHDDTHGGHDPYNRPWMSSWETTAFARDIASLAALRRRNLAVQKAGMRKKWLDPDRYVFTRAWHGSTVLVGVNRADGAAQIDVSGVELPNGTYADVLGGPALTVEDGKACVAIPPRGIVLYERTLPPPAGRVLVDVQVTGIRTEPGEDVFLIGDAIEMGEWDLARAVPLEHVHASGWATTIAFDDAVGYDVHYKFALRRRGRWHREVGPGHRRRVPASPPAMVGAPAGCVSAIWHDSWRG